MQILTFEYDLILNSLTIVISAEEITKMKEKSLKYERFWVFIKSVRKQWKIQIEKLKNQKFSFILEERIQKKFKKFIWDL